MGTLACHRAAALAELFADGRVTRVRLPARLAHRRVQDRRTSRLPLARTDGAHGRARVEGALDTDNERTILAAAVLAWGLVGLRRAFSSVTIGDALLTPYDLIGTRCGLRVRALAVPHTHLFLGVSYILYPHQASGPVTVIYICTVG